MSVCICTDAVTGGDPEPSIHPLLGVCCILATLFANSCLLACICICINQRDSERGGVQVQVIYL